MAPLPLGRAVGLALGRPTRGPVPWSFHGELSWVGGQGGTFHLGGNLTRRPGREEMPSPNVLRRKMVRLGLQPEQRPCSDTDSLSLGHPGAPHRELQLSSAPQGALCSGGACCLWASGRPVSELAVSPRSLASWYVPDIIIFPVSQM